MFENAWTFIVIAGFIPTQLSWEQTEKDGPVTIVAAAQAWSFAIKRHNGRTLAWRLKVPAWDWLMNLIASCL